MSMCVLVVAVFIAWLSPRGIGYGLENLLALTGRWTDGSLTYYVTVTGNNIEINQCPSCLQKTLWQGEVSGERIYGKYVEDYRAFVPGQPNYFSFPFEGVVNADGRKITMKFTIPGNHKVVRSTGVEVRGPDTPITLVIQKND